MGTSIGRHGKDRGSHEDEPAADGETEGRKNVALADSGLSDLAPLPGTKIALTAVALCIVLGLFGGVALRASGR